MSESQEKPDSVVISQVASRHAGFVPLHAFQISLWSFPWNFLPRLGHEVEVFLPNNPG